MQIQKLSDRQKILATGSIVVLSFALVFLVQVSRVEKSPAAMPAQSTLAVQSGKPAVVVSAQSPIAPTAAMQVEIGATSAAPVSVASTADAKPSWQMGSLKSDTPSIRLSEKVSQYAVVEIDQNPDQRPAVGQQIQLPMLNGEVLVANVESANANPNGDYSWSGHLEGAGTDYPVVMTYGEHSIFATITTPQGSYTMESIDGLGWLYKNPAEIELSNPGAKDFLDVPHE